MTAWEDVVLAPGYTIPRIIRGCWQLAGGHGEVDRAAALDDLMAFYDSGITTFDCADIYTGVEELIGAWRAAVRLRGGEEALARLKVHTKFVPDLDILPRIDRAYVRAIIERSLKRLNTERLDLVQFHWWDYAVPGMVETAQWLGELQREGKIDLIGGTNFDREHMAEIVAAGVALRSMQVQYSLLDDRPRVAMAEEAQHLGVGLLCYGTLAGGFLCERWLNVAEPHEVQANRSLTKYKLIIDEFGGWDLFQTLLATLSAIATRHGVDIAAVASRYVLQQPAVSAVIVGARDASHLPSMRAIARLRLSRADIDEIETVLAARRGPPGEVYALERDRDGPHGAIMKYNLNAG